MQYRLAGRVDGVGAHNRRAEIAIRGPNASARIRGALSVTLARGSIALLLFLAACGGDGDGGSTPSETGTIAYVETSCRQYGGDMTLQQDVRILRSDADPVTAMSIGPLGPFTSDLCGIHGSNRYAMREIGPVRRFGITPDGSGVAFEVTDVSIRDLGWVLPPGQAGIYYAPADGSGLRRLGPASRSPATFYSPSGVALNDFSLAFHPSGEQFAYTDRGPDEAGHDAAQVFVQGLMPGARKRQVTQLPALDLPGQWPEITFPSFIDPRTIIFSRWTQPGTQRTSMTVDIDTHLLSDLPTVALPGAELIPIFKITGEDWIGFIATLPGEPVNPFGDRPIREVGVTDGTNVLLLTNFRRVDTVLNWPFYSARDRRVYFTASANPFDTNRSENCQIFSIDPLGSDLRQLTFFRERAAHATDGCWGTRRGNACTVLFGPTRRSSQNPDTGDIFFSSNCDPLGQNPYGWQIFAMQPDGSDLRQLTNARGAFRGTDGAFEVDIVDAFLNAPYQ